MQYDEPECCTGTQTRKGRYRILHRSAGARHRTHTSADGTSEEVRYENVNRHVRARRDRAGQWLSYLYDGGGQRERDSRRGRPTTTPPW